MLTGQGKALHDLAEVFGVNRSTITEWRTNHPEFSAAILLGREDASDRVERALFERACGYSHPTVKPMAVSLGDGQGSRIELVQLTEQYPPDTAAALAWLKNRRPDQWRDRQEIAHTGTLTLEQLLSDSWKKPEGEAP